MVVVCYWFDVIGCPTLTSVNSSSEKRREARGRGTYFELNQKIYICALIIYTVINAAIFH